MRLFIKRMVVFALVTIGLVFFFQILISARIKGKTVRGHDNLEQTSNVHADLVLMGSSRCWSHLDPVFFDSTFKLRSINIGVDGHSEISMAIIRLKDYLSRNVPPKFAICTFDPFVSSGKQKNNTNYVHKNDFARYAFFPKEKDLLIVDYFGFNFFEKYVPLYAIFKYKLLANCIFLNNRSNYVDFGYERHDLNWDTIATPVSDKMKGFYFKESDIPAIQKSADSLVQLCKSNNIKLMFIQTPVYKVCYDDSAFSMTSKICSGMNIPFIDVNDEYIRNNIKFFYNSNHLNTTGVNAMNSLLSKDSLLRSFLQ
ncbi:hypothetical protein [Flavihumibacter fluvii]|uniref:hypothetical protein n=1 Tax=Flavihumibacter fluvii TaxID=2838157 RepID=UPI001BDE9134|nr:hypothetical protein [Flavihumibacter fluvii]ULQ52385.1 hypothetical protein KJS93_20055 [Flavihumibacter fluvii]